MAPFVVDPTRVDPYRNDTLRFACDGRHVTDVSKVSALRRPTATEPAET